MDHTTSAPTVRVLDDPAARVFDDDRLLPVDARSLASLGRQVGAGADLAAPPVVLPDFHHKSKMELPSSVAVATNGTVRPDLTGSSVNCGMALVALDCDLPHDRAVDAFMRAVREHYPYPTRGRRDLTASEVVRAAADGAHFGVERWDAPPEDLERIEEHGRLDLERYGGIDRLVKELPGFALQLSRYRFGTVGPSNHFVELQRVEEVLDPERATALGVAEGQLTLQYHGGGGVLAGELGRLFFRRKDYPRQIKAVNAALKPWFHLRTARSYAQLRQRLHLYFTDGCEPLALDSDEGQRLMLANAAAMNYGFAFRIATYATLRRLAAECFGGATGRLVVDSPHNSIYEEDVAGTDAVVHRHNSCRAFPAERMRPGTTFASTGQAVLLPGTHRTSSYLAVAGPRAEASLHSACHGAGTVVSQLVDRGLSSTDPLGRQHASLPVRRRGAGPGGALRRRRGRRGAARARAQRPGHPGRPDATHRSPALAHDGDTHDDNTRTPGGGSLPAPGRPDALGPRPRHGSERHERQLLGRCHGGGVQRRGLRHPGGAVLLDLGGRQEGDRPGRHGARGTGPVPRAGHGGRLGRHRGADHVRRRRARRRGARHPGAGRRGALDRRRPRRRGPRRTHPRRRRARSSSTTPGSRPRRPRPRRRPTAGSTTPPRSCSTSTSAEPTPATGTASTPAPSPSASR